MDRQNRHPIAPGASVLGGAGSGLSYEGALRDAVALEERDRRREAGRSRVVPMAQSQTPHREAERLDQSRISGG
jgi:hypothetical protein